MPFWSFKMSTIIYFIFKYIIYFYFINYQSLVSWSVLWFHFKLSSSILYKVILYFDFIIPIFEDHRGPNLLLFFFWVTIIVAFFLLCLLISDCLIICIYLWGSYRPKLGFFWCFYYKQTGLTETIYLRLRLEPIHCELNPASTHAWKIPWMEEPGRLQSMGSQRVGHDWATSLSLFTFMHWRRQWQPTPVFLLGESQGQGSLVGCRLWVTQSQTRLKQLSSSSSSKTLATWFQDLMEFRFLMSHRIKNSVRDKW